MTNPSTKNTDPLKQKSYGHHDVFFKEFYANPHFAFELFQLVFSKKELNAFDWTKLKTEKDTFPDKRADLVFSVPLKHKSQVRFKICILLEHKAQYSRQLFSQILDYQYFIHKQTLRDTRQPMPVIPVLFYHGKKPWKWSVSFQEGVWGKAFAEIPAGCRKSMLNYELKLLDVQEAKVTRILKNQSVQSRGALYLLREIWWVKPEAAALERAIGFLKDLAGQRDDLILSVVDYLFKAVPGMSREVWEKAEKDAVAKGLLIKGGYMDVKERIREEGRQEGRQEGREEGRQDSRREVVRNMLQNNLETPLISKVTGLSEKEINKLKNGS